MNILNAIWSSKLHLVAFIVAANATTTAAASHREHAMLAGRETRAYVFVPAGGYPRSLQRADFSCKV